MEEGHVRHRRRDGLVSADFVRTSSSPRIVGRAFSGGKSLFDPVHRSAVQSSCLQYTRNNLNTEPALDFDYGSWIKQLMQQPRSLLDEMHQRNCLTKALTNLCKQVTENTILDGYELDILESESCITGEDRFYVEAGKIGPIKRSRRLLSLVILRDFRTILVFLKGLLPENKHVVGMILKKFEKYARMNFRKPLKCTMCQLVSRVDMSLIIDDLLSDDEDWLMFYVRVSQTECVGPNADFWRELINAVTAQSAHEQVLNIVIKVLSSCGFHSDIVKMLNEDKEQHNNSFVCRCLDMNSHHRSTREPRMTLVFTEQHCTNNGRSRGSVVRSSMCVERDGGDQVHLTDAREPCSERTNRSVCENNVVARSFRRDENICHDDRKKCFSSKSKSLDRLKMIESVNENKSGSKYLLKGKGWFDWNKQHIVTRDLSLYSYSNARDYQINSLKPTRRLESRKETLRKIVHIGQLPTANDIGDNPHTQENFSYEMALLKDDISDSELETETLNCPDATQSFGSFLHDKSFQNLDTVEYKLEQSKTCASENKEDDGRCEQEMYLLKIGIPEYENENIIGLHQSEQTPQKCNTANNFDTATNDTEGVLQVAYVNSYPLSDDSSETHGSKPDTLDGYKKAFESVTFRQYNYRKKTHHREQDLKLGSRKRVQLDCSDANDTSSLFLTILYLVIVTILMCFVDFFE